MSMLCASPMLLTDLFEMFRRLSMTTSKFEVDPAQYLSASQMACEAMLKKTGLTMDLIFDPAIYLMNEGGLRGAVCMINRRHAKANNPALGPLYDHKLPTSTIF